MTAAVGPWCFPCVSASGLRTADVTTPHRYLCSNDCPPCRISNHLARCRFCFFFGCWLRAGNPLACAGLSAACSNGMPGPRQHRVGWSASRECHRVDVATRSQLLTKRTHDHDDHDSGGRRRRTIHLAPGTARDRWPAGNGASRCGRLPRMGAGA